ncbi:MAG: hypothetical protein ACRC2J_18110 [Microcoleaceae cyanobacterium]
MIEMTERKNILSVRETEDGYRFYLYKSYSDMGYQFCIKYFDADNQYDDDDNYLDTEEELILETRWTKSIYDLISGKTPVIKYVEQAESFSNYQCLDDFKELIEQAGVIKGLPELKNCKILDAPNQCLFPMQDAIFLEDDILRYKDGTVKTIRRFYRFSTPEGKRYGCQVKEYVRDKNNKDHREDHYLVGYSLDEIKTRLNEF